MYERIELRKEVGEYPEVTIEIYAKARQGKLKEFKKRIERQYMQSKSLQSKSIEEVVSWVVREAKLNFYSLHIIEIIR